jgi:hypothetical protein
MTRRMRGREFYTVTEIMDILPLGRVAIASYLRSGRIMGVKIGRLWYVDRIELDRFLDSRYQLEQKSLKKDIQS